MSLSAASLAAIDREVAKYPPKNKQSAVMGALAIAQRETGWVSPDIMKLVGQILEIPIIRVAEVATFYAMYDLKPIGRHKICVCTNISCMLRGSDDITRHLRETLGIGFGETTDDGRFSLKEVECLAACGGAPMMSVDGQYYEDLSPRRVDEILAELE